MANFQAHWAGQGDEYSILQMEEEDALQVFQQIVASVRYIHKMGIVSSSQSCISPVTTHPVFRVHCNG
eukprot:1626028-Amphidinium_carterae.1